MANGLSVVVIGLSGMLARLLVREQSSPAVGAVKSAIGSARHLAASIFSTFIAWNILNTYDMSETIKTAVYAIVGIAAPEILNGVTKAVSKLADDPLALVDRFTKKNG